MGDTSGVIHCLDLNGKCLWTHDLLTPVWGALLVAGGHLYVGDEDGMMTVMRACREKQIVARIDMSAPILGAPAVARGVLYIATGSRLYAIAQE